MLLLFTDRIHRAQRSGTNYQIFSRGCDLTPDLAIVVIPSHREEAIDEPLSEQEIIEISSSPSSPEEVTELVLSPSPPSSPEVEDCRSNSPILSEIYETRTPSLGEIYRTRRRLLDQKPNDLRSRAGREWLRKWRDNGFAWPISGQYP